MNSTNTHEKLSKNKRNIAKSVLIGIISVSMITTFVGCSDNSESFDLKTATEMTFALNNSYTELQSDTASTETTEGTTESIETTEPTATEAVNTESDYKYEKQISNIVKKQPLKDEYRAELDSLYKENPEQFQKSLLKCIMGEEEMKYVSYYQYLGESGEARATIKNGKSDLKSVDDYYSYIEFSFPISDVKNQVCMVVAPKNDIVKQLFTQITTLKCYCSYCSLSSSKIIIPDGKYEVYTGYGIVVFQKSKKVTTLSEWK